MSACETRIMTALEAQLNQIPGVWVWRSNCGAAQTQDGRWVYFGKKGQADLSGILMCGSVGIALFVEVKTATGRLRPEQREFRDMVGRFGGCYVEAHSVEEGLRGIEAFRAAHVS